MDPFLRNILIAIVAAAIIGTISLAFAGRRRLYRAVLIVWGVLCVVGIIFFAGYGAGANAEHAFIESACKTDACKQFVPLFAHGNMQGLIATLYCAMGLSLLWGVSSLPDLIAFIERKSGGGGSGS